VSALSVFWAEWDRRTSGETRSLERARLLIEALGIGEPGMPILTVVGSKGKGTAATYGSAYLASAGARVVTVTSPGLRGVRDRIRTDGRSIAEPDLASLAERLDEARRTLPPYRPGSGYLSPSGLFIIAGALHARTVAANLLVLEAGMGGASDEVSLFDPTVVGITSIFGEHLGVLGDTPAEIAADKAGVVAASTQAVVSMPQDPLVEKAIADRVVAGIGDLASLVTVEPGYSGVPARLLPHGLSRFNAELGCIAAQRLLDATGRTVPNGDRLSKTLATVVLPGRMSWHDVPGTPCRVFADAAIDRAGIAAALTEVSWHWSDIDRVLLCMPDHKDVVGAITELADLPVTFVRLTDKPRLRFTRELPANWEVVDVGLVDREFLPARGERLVAFGTGYFISRILDLIDADTDRLFTPPVP
jgi:dihydrofolate synthase / folylpolyglutamate synthase